MKIIYLRPMSTYRTPLRSDTLFGLLMWGIHEIHGDEVVEELIELFRNGEPPFLISSAMPFSEEGDGMQLFFPKPLIPLNCELKMEQMDQYKNFKKLIWLPQSVFEELCSGNLSMFEFFNDLEWFPHKEIPYWKGAPIPQPRVKTQTVMHNVIDRLSSSAGGEAGNLFGTEESIIKRGGLFFLMEVLRDDLLNLLEGVFQFYHHIGFGGDASIGKGSFEFEISDYTQNFSNPSANSLMNLSLYLAKKEELIEFRKQSDFLWYQMEMRKGKVGGKLFVTDNVWKKSVNAFREGSCFPKIPNHIIYGQFPTVKEELPKPVKENETFNAHYYGYALMIDYQQKRDT